MADEIRTIVEMAVDYDSLFASAFSPKWLNATKDKEAGAYQRFTDFIKRENPRTFVPDELKIGNDDTTWYLSYYGDGKLYRIMKDGRIRLEGPDPMDVLDRQYNELCDLVKAILVNEMLGRARAVINNKSDGIYKIENAKPLNITDEGMYHSYQLLVVPTKRA